MGDLLKDLVERGKALPPDERERLVEELLRSSNLTAAAELSELWETEIARRLDRYDRGETHAIDAQDVFAKARGLTR